MFSGIGVIIVSYDSLLPISTGYWAIPYLLGIHIVKEITYTEDWAKSFYNPLVISSHH